MKIKCVTLNFTFYDGFHFLSAPLPHHLHPNSLDVKGASASLENRESNSLMVLKLTELILIF